jgi:glycosyltransferase involved in cell wall biosynthesis
MALGLSIALATHNGERYLAEQLESFAAQHRRPDELVVCDDASTDGTVAILERFSSNAPFAVRIEVNGTRLGCAGNFARALSLCTGDVLFLSDQDDVWLSDKLGTIESVLLARPDVGMVFGDMHIVDRELSPLGYTGFDALGFRAKPMRIVQEGRTFEALLRYNVISGATMGFRAHLRDLVLPIGAGWVHDEWIALLVSAVTEVGLIDRPLVLYRQHTDQQIGLKRLGWMGQLRVAWAMGKPYMQRMVERADTARGRLLESGRPLVRPQYADLLGAKLEHARGRLAMRTTALRAPMVLAALRRGDYDRFDYGWKSAMQDLLMP